MAEDRPSSLNKSRLLRLVSSGVKALGKRTQPQTEDLSFSPARPEPGRAGGPPGQRSTLSRLWRIIITFGKFVGPGFMIAVAYSTHRPVFRSPLAPASSWLILGTVDPGNYSTDIAAGASYRFKLLFIVLLSNLFAIFLQSLCIKLGTVTGLNLAEACRAFLPRWLNYILYGLAEIAIIATDVAEVKTNIKGFRWAQGI